MSAFAASQIPDPASVGRSRWTRLIPIAIVVYIISFMDRTNIGFAFDGIGKSLHVSSSGEGLAGGIFFIGYLVFQIPGGHLAEHWSAKKFVGIMILVWGVFAVLSGLVQNFTELLIVRFMLGVAEGGIWPAILVMIAHWFPAKERARAYGFWIMNIAIASMITAPLSGWILSFSDWRMLFLVEGAIPFLIAPLWFLFASDWPREAKWCSRGEREYIERSLEADRAGEPPHGGYRDVIRNPVVWKLVLVYFLIQIGFYGLNLWLPHVVGDITGGGDVAVGFVTAIPYVFAIVGLWLNGRSADKTGKYRVHVFAAMALASVSLVLSVVLGSVAAILSMFLLSLAMMGALAYDGPFWASASRAVPVALAGGAMGLINALGNLGGFAGPYLGGWLQDLNGGGFMLASLMLALSLGLAGVAMLWVGRVGDQAGQGTAVPEGEEAAVREPERVRERALATDQTTARTS